MRLLMPGCTSISCKTGAEIRRERARTEPICPFSLGSESSSFCNHCCILWGIPKDAEITTEPTCALAKDWQHLHPKFDK